MGYFATIGWFRDAEAGKGPLADWAVPTSRSTSPPMQQAKDRSDTEDATEASQCIDYRIERTISDDAV